MGIATHLVLLTLVAYSLSDPHTMALNKPDCRKFVFAPICRGVAAKRSQPINFRRNEILFDENRLKDLMQDYNRAPKDWSDNPEEVSSASKPGRSRPSSNNGRLETEDLPGFFEYDHK